MTFFRNLFGRRDSSFDESVLNPLPGLKLEEFAIAGSLRVKHYFQFRNKEGKNEEFVVMYDYFDPELIYSRALYRRTGEADFSRLNEQVWSIPISYLIELGKGRSATTPPTHDHFISELR